MTQHHDRIPCRAVFLDAGGVIGLPHRGLVRDALARVEIEIDPSPVSRAHYRAARQIDRDRDSAGAPADYLNIFCSALGVPPQLLADAVGALSRLADRSLSGEICGARGTTRAGHDRRAHPSRD